jgi:hypothetical protein
MEIGVPPNSEESFKVFKAVTPEEIGEYKAGVLLGLHHPSLGEARFLHKESLIVGSVIPSGLLKLMLYSTFIASTILLLNLILGFDILE